MTGCTEPYVAQYLEGRRCGRDGAARDTNPYFARPDGQAGQPESAEVWRSKYDIWRQGWMEGHDAFEHEGAAKQASDSLP